MDIDTSGFPPPAVPHLHDDLRQAVAHLDVVQDGALWREIGGCLWVNLALDDGHPREEVVTISLSGPGAQERGARMLAHDKTWEG